MARPKITRKDGQNRHPAPASAKRRYLPDYHASGESVIYEVIIFGSVIAFTTAMTFVEFRRLRKKLEAKRQNTANSGDQRSDAPVSKT